MIKYILIFTFVGILNLSPAYSSIQNDMLIQSKNIKRTIEEKGYTTEICNLLQNISQTKDINQFSKELDGDTLAIIAQFSRDEKEYKIAATWYVEAIEKGINDNYVISYLSSIFEKREIDLVNKDYSKIIETLQSHWKNNDAFVEDLVKNKMQNEVTLPPLPLEAEDIANYFLMIGAYISNLKLQKLCFFAQGYHKALYDWPLFKDPIEAWVHGPVISKLWYKYNYYGYTTISKPQNINISLYDNNIKSFLNLIYDIYGKYSPYGLRDMSHKYPCWKNTPRNQIITLESMKNDFSQNKEILNQLRTTQR